MNRRQFLKTFGVGAVAAAPLMRVLAALPEGAFAPAPASSAPVANVVGRLTFGITPDLYTHLQTVDTPAFIAEQLAPETIDDSDAEQRMQEFADILSQNGGVLAQEYGGMRNIVEGALIGQWITRATYSQRQLYERMVQFFSNHFYEYAGKAIVLFLKVDDERDVIRPNVMTNFRQLLGASAHSPAMLLFLDNAESTKDVPNENYARELMELQTVSVDGGYSETDVKEVARCLTGWSITRPKDSPDGSIKYMFRPFIHDGSSKTVMGHTIPARGGEQDGETVLDLLASSPSTARFISTKLARRFVSDTPPDSLVQSMAATFQQSNGDIKSVLKTLFASSEFQNAPPKFKQPIEYAVSVLRALNFDITNQRRFLNYISKSLQSMGQVPFGWVMPNGFPDTEDQWTGSLLSRWNLALAAVNNQITGAEVNVQPLLDLMTSAQISNTADDRLGFMGSYLLGRDLSSDEQAIVVGFAKSVASDSDSQLAAGTALLLGSPAFQYR